MRTEFLPKMSPRSAMTQRSVQALRAKYFQIVSFAKLWWRTKNDFPAASSSLPKRYCVFVLAWIRTNTIVTFVKWQLANTAWGNFLRAFCARRKRIERKENRLNEIHWVLSNKYKQGECSENSVCLVQLLAGLASHLGFHMYNLGLVGCHLRWFKTLIYFTPDQAHFQES